MKIGIIQQAPDMGGAEEYTILLAKYFKKDKHKVYFATNNSRFESALSKYSHRTYRIPFRLDIIGNYRGLIKSLILLPYGIIFYLNLLSKFKKDKVDVILMSGFSEKMLVTFLSVFFKIRVIWVEHGPLRTIFIRNFKIPWIAYKLNFIAKYIIVPANITKKDLIMFGKVPENKILVVPDGVEISKKRKKEKEEEGLVIGNVSRLTREKGQDFIILSAPKVLEKYPKTKFILVGSGPDKKYYETLIKRLKLTKSFEVTGYVKDVSKYYNEFDIFIFPTIWELEGFGLVLTEAMAHKVPIIANNLGPVPEVVGDAGVLVKPKDASALSDAINMLINDKNKRGIYGKKGYLRARNNYDIKKISKDILKVLEN